MDDSRTLKSSVLLLARRLGRGPAALRTLRLTRPILLILPPRREETSGDVLLERSRLFDQRIEPLEEGSEVLGGEKALLGHRPITGRQGPVHAEDT